jgi:Haem-dependent oxidative N-demethylase, alpha subunit-like
MDFDFSNITVPFRMQPGLQRVAKNEPWLTRLDPTSKLYAEKLAVVRAGQSRHIVTGFDPEPALAAIAACDPGSPAACAAPKPIELAFEEDFAVLDGTTGTVPWLCVCVPSHWAPEDKLGLDFAALHGPVADNSALLAASPQLVGLVTAGECWERYVWTISPSARYDQHPRRHARAPWPAVADPQAFAQQCWLRAERQTFSPVGQGTRQAVFAIRVMVQPLTRFIQTPAQARRMRDSLASMSQAVIEYKSLAAARERLLLWLDLMM